MCGVGLAVRISLISRSRPEKQRIYGLHFEFWLSADVGHCWHYHQWNGHGRKVGVAIGTPLISRSNPEIHRISGLMAANLFVRCQLTSGTNGSVAIESGMIEMWDANLKSPFHDAKSCIGGHVCGHIEF